MISKSYPYISIAKKHNKDYGRILEAAHILTHGSQEDVHSLLNAAKYDETGVLVEIQEAVMYFKGIQSGSIPFPST